MCSHPGTRGSEKGQKEREAEGESAALLAGLPQPVAVSFAITPALVCGSQRPAVKLIPRRSGRDA